ncbi:MAG: hypothetical protein II559_07670 [Muribaculaceae bacterium]|nr:hypothetical protein [Muribaculaceae bacterium]
MKNILALLLIVFSCASMSSQEVVDYLNVGSTIEFNGGASEDMSFRLILK